MRIALPTILVMLALLPLGPSGAQQVPAKGAAEVATAAQEAWRAGDYEAFYATLSPGVQGQIAELHREMLRSIRPQSLKNEEFAGPLFERLALLDPENKLKLSHGERLINLRDAEFLAMASGLLAVSYQLRRQGEAWRMIDFAEGWRTQRLRGAAEEGGMMMVAAARAQFATMAGLQLELEMSRLGTEWRVESFALQGPRHQVSLAAFLKEGAYYDVRWPGVAPREDRREAGEALLKQALEKALVAYKKRQSKGDAIDAVARLIEQADTKDAPYSLDRIATDFGRKGLVAMLVAKPGIEGDPWLILLFDWDSEVRQIAEVKNEEELNSRLKRRR